MGILIKGMDEIPEDGAVLVVKHDNGKAYIKHACTYGYSMELVKLPAAQPDHNADIGKKAEGDCISRQMAIEAICKACSMVEDYHKCDYYPETSVLCDELVALRALPSVQPDHNADVSKKVERTDETAQNVQNEDLISRKWLVECIEEGWVKFDTAKDCNRMMHLVRDIAPSAQPEQNGKWIYNSPTTMKCDRCGFAIKDWDWHRFKYCPNCRADMRGGEKK